MKRQGKQMSTQTPERSEARRSTASETEFSVRSNRLFAVVAIVAMVVGGFSVLGGIAGAIYTYQQAAVENIVTPDDARIAEAPVRGPLTMWAQSDIITEHQLDRTGGQRYAEMEREVQQVDEDGTPMVDENGDPVMGPNMERLSWIDATSLTTVLGMGILAYAFSAFAIAVGLTLVALGLVVFKLRRSAAALV
jgi:hypothetical protein